MKKVILILVLIMSFIKADIWEAGWAQGYNIFNLTNDKGDNLKLECGETGSGIYVNDENDENDSIIFIFNKSEKYTVVQNLKTNLGMYDILGFDKMLYALGSAKDIIVKKGNKTYNFQVDNLEKAKEIVNFCDSESIEKRNADLPNGSNQKEYQSEQFSTPEQIYKLSLDTQYNPLTYSNMNLVGIIPLIDNLVIKKLIVNNGQCAVSRNDYKMRDIKENIVAEQFQKINFLLLNNPGENKCKNIMKIEVITNYGSWVHQAY